MKILVGIDTGVNTGFAVAFDNGNGGDLQQVKSLTITKAMDEVKGLISTYDNSNIRLYIEDARLRTWFTGGKEKAQGAGSIKRDSKIWEDWCKENNINYLMIHPKANSTKYKSDKFKQITGWRERTNEHARDAAMLVYKRFYK